MLKFAALHVVSNDKFDDSLINDKLNMKRTVVLFISLRLILTNIFLIQLSKQ